MQGPLGSYFQNTITNCFSNALDMMGPLVREAVVDHLVKRGIQESQAGVHFHETLDFLEKFGTTGKMILYNTLIQVCEEYSFPVDFTSTGPLREKFDFLKERVIVDRLTPRHALARTRDAHLSHAYHSIFDLFSIDSSRVRT